MNMHSFLTGFKAAFPPRWKKHGTVIFIIALLLMVAVSSNVFVKTQPTHGRDVGSPSSADDESLRACSSVGTIFEYVHNLTDVMALFKQRASGIVKEREDFLFTPSQWQCLPGLTGSVDPPMPMLQQLAAEMPGWYFRYGTPGNMTKIFKPVTFASFTSILGEFAREYECKLTEFQNSVFADVAMNNDLKTGENPPNQFCCNLSNECGLALDSAYCSGPTTGDAQCDLACDLAPTMSDFATRPLLYVNRQLVERQRARAAVERTILALRSFEINYAYAKQLTCFQRASLDLKNELGLLADTASCLPRIWDAATSLHDRKGQ